MDQKKHKPWILPRHRVILNLAKPVLSAFCRWKCGITVDPFTDQGDGQYLVLMNHTTVYDQFFIGMAFRGPVYYLASEDIFSNGLVSRLLRFAVNPIPIKKQTIDLKAIRTCMQVVKEGGTLALAPEGNRSYSGRTEYMNPAIAKLAKRLGLPIALFRIEEGYGIQPRWAEYTRKGKMRAGVRQVITPEEYRDLSDEQLFSRIREGLFVDEAQITGEFHHPKLAENLERAIYICPHCGMAKFESAGDTFRCTKCGRQGRYLPDKRLEGDFEFPFVAQWYDWQKDYVNSFDSRLWLEEPIFRDQARLSEVIIGDRKQVLWERAEMTLYGDRVELCSGEAHMTFRFDEADAFTVLGRNKLNVYHGGKVYQFKGDPRFNALKYVHLFHRYNNLQKGEPYEQFLGL